MLFLVTKQKPSYDIPSFLLIFYSISIINHLKKTSPTKKKRRKKTSLDLFIWFTRSLRSCEASSVTFIPFAIGDLGVKKHQTLPTIQLDVSYQSAFSALLWLNPQKLTSGYSDLSPFGIQLMKIVFTVTAVSVCLNICYCKNTTNMAQGQKLRGMVFS